MTKFVLSTSIFFLSLTACTSNSSSDTSYLDAGSDYSENTESAGNTETENYANSNSSVKIPYTEMYGNTITVPVKINGMKLTMIFDTGASSTCITQAEAQYLYEKGMLAQDDILDTQQFQTADGSIATGWRVILREVWIGDEIRLENVEALVVQNQQAPLLLGQSIMKQFREISVDRENGVVKFFK
jgi:aspartyl protease family protein